MNHYQKLSCLGFRLVGIAYFIYGFFWLVFGILRLLSKNNSPEDNGSGVVFWSTVVNFGFSSVIFLLGKPLGKFIGRDLEN